MVRIDFVKFGEVMIDGEVYYSDMIVWWDGQREFVPKDHILGTDNFSALLRRKPDIIVIGTGLQGMVKITDEARHLAEEKGIKIFEHTSPEAADLFNAMIADSKNVVAYIHTTG
jgi:hypothetical protein